ncbi:hypothetical protein C8R44DRAFT_853853 [Mycena epipterygia]|nr:hypothetical protein C8R44DRAFT_853853 [Mycena epipterygia]
MDLGVLRDNARGMFVGETIYDDTDADQIESLSPAQPHRNVDLEIINADKDGTVPILASPIERWFEFLIGYIKSYIILLPTVPSLMIAASRSWTEWNNWRRKNMWPNVEIHEQIHSSLPLGDLYFKLYDSIVSNPATGHGRNGIYFGVNGEHQMYDLARAIAETLVALRASYSTLALFTQEEIQKYIKGSENLGTNSRCIAKRSYSIGWAPVKTTKDLVASIYPEVQALLERRKSMPEK